MFTFLEPEPPAAHIEVAPRKLGPGAINEVP